MPEGERLLLSEPNRTNKEGSIFASNIAIYLWPKHSENEHKGWRYSQIQRVTAHTCMSIGLTTLLLLAHHMLLLAHHMLLLPHHTAASQQVQTTGEPGLILVEFIDGSPSLSLKVIITRSSIAR